VFNPKPLGNNQYEIECMVCKYPLIMEPGDQMHVHVGAKGEVDGVFCTRCFGLANNVLCEGEE